MKKKNTMTEEPFLSMYTVTISAIAIGAIVLAGLGLKIYSDKIEKKQRQEFYHLLARTLCDFFSKAAESPCAIPEEQMVKMLIARKHGGSIPGLRMVKLRLSPSEDKNAFIVELLVLRGQELSTLRFSRIDWTALPADIQTDAIQAAGSTSEYLLMD